MLRPDFRNAQTNLPFANARLLSRSAKFHLPYSFGDEHINRLLLTALQNPTLQLVAYVPTLRVTDSDVNSENCPAWVGRLLSLKLGQVTFVGNGPAAYVDRMVGDLADPAVFDDGAHDVKQALQKLVQADDARSLL